ncbi:MAG: FAD-binding protein, partial [Thermomicrobiales bacterium]|nr:FAD-binding protein [Thermomicrobiales bacterium]
MATTLTPDTIADPATMELRAAVRGAVLTPDDPGYETARQVRNGLIDRRPRCIVRCTGTADVVTCVNVAREHGLLLSVRGGAHNVAGNATNDGGLVTDLSGLRAVTVDPATQSVWAQG